MKSFFGIKESKKENVCPICGGKLIDDFCDTCNKYSSSEIAQKKLKEKYPHVRCKCKSKKIEFSIEEQKAPIPKNILDKTALEIIKKYNQKYPPNIPAYREVAKCKKCGNKWYVDGYRDDNKIMVSMRNGFLIFLVAIFFALVITIGSISEKKQVDFEADNVETTSHITQNDMEETTGGLTENTTISEISTTESVSTTDAIIDDEYGEIGSDIEIVTKANHPQYLDDVKIAEDVWEYEIDENKVAIVGLYDSAYTRSHIIEIGTSEYEQDGNEIEYISSVDIYFERFDETVSFEEALHIISTYLPKNTIQQYYVEEISCLELTDFENQTRYSKSYELKDESYIDIPQLDSSFCVMVWVDEKGNATEARIDYAVISPFDDDTMDKWNYDFFSTNNEKNTIETTEKTTTTEKVSITEATTKEITTTKSGRIVYITPYGEKYHCSASCAGSNAMERDYDDVEGVYDPCKKCAY